MFVVYRIKSKKTGKYYLGSTGRYPTRIKEHKWRLLNGKHENKSLLRVFLKYGMDDLSFRIVKKYPSLKAARLDESRRIDAAASDKLCLNEMILGDVLYKNPNRDVIRKGQGRKIAGSKNGMFGRTHTKAVRRASSLKNRGNQHAVGYVRSKELRELDRKRAQERVSKSDYANPFAGKAHSKKTRSVISAKNKANFAAGMQPPNARRVRIGNTIYPSASAAGRAVGAVTATILNRIANERFPDYSYLD